MFDLRSGGLYLPPLVLLIIQPDIGIINLPIIQQSVSLLNILIGGSLLGAVFFHGFTRNVFGIGGPEENPKKRSEVIRDIQVTLTGKGPRHNFPGTFAGMLALFTSRPNLIGISGIIFTIVGILTSIIWSLSIFIALYYGILNINRLDTVPQLIVFLTLVWFVQWQVWRFFEPAYLLEEEDFSAEDEIDLDHDSENEELTEQGQADTSQ